MRSFNHCLAASRSGKSVHFQVTVNDRYGEQPISLSWVFGWRAELAKKHLSFDSDEWGGQAVRTFVGVNTLRAARDKFEALHYIDTVKSMNIAEVHFWAGKFLSNHRTKSAWRVFYGP